MFGLEGHEHAGDRDREDRQHGNPKGAVETFRVETTYEMMVCVVSHGDLLGGAAEFDVLRHELSAPRLMYASYARRVAYRSAKTP